MQDAREQLGGLTKVKDGIDIQVGDLNPFKNQFISLNNNNNWEIHTNFRLSIPQRQIQEDVDAKQAAKELDAEDVGQVLDAQDFADEDELIDDDSAPAEHVVVVTAALAAGAAAEEEDYDAEEEEKEEKAPPAVAAGVEIKPPPTATATQSVPLQQQQEEEEKGQSGIDLSVVGKVGTEGAVLRLSTLLAPPPHLAPPSSLPHAQRARQRALDRKAAQQQQHHHYQKESYKTTTDLDAFFSEKLELSSVEEDSEDEALERQRQTSPKSILPLEEAEGDGGGGGGSDKATALAADDVDTTTVGDEDDKQAKDGYLPSTSRRNLYQPQQQQHIKKAAAYAVIPDEVLAPSNTVEWEANIKWEIKELHSDNDDEEDGDDVTTDDDNNNHDDSMIDIEQGGILVSAPLLRKQLYLSPHPPPQSSFCSSNQRRGPAAPAPPAPAWEDRIAWEGSVEEIQMKLPPQIGGPWLDLNDPSLTFEYTTNREKVAKEDAELMQGSAAIILHRLAARQPTAVKLRDSDAGDKAVVELARLNISKDETGQPKKRAGGADANAIQHSMPAIKLITLPVIKNPHRDTHEKPKGGYDELASWHRPRSSWWPVDIYSTVLKLSLFGGRGSSKKPRQPAQFVSMELATLPGISIFIPRVDVYNTTLRQVWQAILNIASSNNSVDQQQQIDVPSYERGKILRIFQDLIPDTDSGTTTSLVGGRRERDGDKGQPGPSSSSLPSSPTRTAAKLPVPVIVLPGVQALSTIPLNIDVPIIQCGAPDDKFSTRKTLSLKLLFKEVEMTSTKMINESVESRRGAGTASVAFRNVADLQAAHEGHVVLVEYLEEEPPLLNRPGMGLKLVTFYRKKDAADVGHRALKDAAVGDGMEWQVGAVQPLGDTDDSPFLGELAPGKHQLSTETNLYRSPAHPYTPPASDFLVVRSRSGAMHLREITGMVACGQELPMRRIPAPGGIKSRGVKELEEARLEVNVFRELTKRQKKNNEKGLRQGVMPLAATVKMRDLAEEFSGRSRTMIRAFLRENCGLAVSGKDDDEVFELREEARLPTEMELRNRCTPDDAAVLEASYVAKYRLKSRGVMLTELFSNVAADKLRLAAEMLPYDDEESKKAAKYVEQAMSTMPSALSDAFVSYFREGTAMLRLEGPGDPTGRGAGFSFIRDVRHKNYNNMDDPTKPSARRMAGKVQGTDADLRRMTNEEARAKLLQFGLTDEEIKPLSRWTRINWVRQFATASAADGLIGQKEAKWVRHRKQTLVEQLQKFRQRAQQIFNRQVSLLNNTAEEDLGNQDELEAALEAELAAEEEEEVEENGGGKSQSRQRGGTPSPEEEARELEKMRALIEDGDDNGKDGGSRQPGASASQQSAGGTTTAPPSQANPQSQSQQPQTGPAGQPLIPGQTRRIRRQVLIQDDYMGEWKHHHEIIYMGRDRPLALSSLYHQDGGGGMMMMDMGDPSAQGPWGFGNRVVMGRPREWQGDQFGRLGYAAARGRGIKRGSRGGGGRGSRGGSMGRGGRGGRGRGGGGGLTPSRGRGRGRGRGRRSVHADSDWEDGGNYRSPSSGGRGRKRGRKSGFIDEDDEFAFSDDDDMVIPEHELVDDDALSEEEDDYDEEFEKLLVDDEDEEGGEKKPPKPKKPAVPRPKKPKQPKPPPPPPPTLTFKMGDTALGTYIIPPKKYEIKDVYKDAFVNIGLSDFDDDDKKGGGGRYGGLKYDEDEDEDYNEHDAYNDAMREKYEEMDDEDEDYRVGGGGGGSRARRAGAVGAAGRKTRQTGKYRQEQYKVAPTRASKRRRSRGSYKESDDDDEEEDFMFDDDDDDYERGGRGGGRRYRAAPAAAKTRATAADTSYIHLPAAYPIAAAPAPAPAAPATKGPKHPVNAIFAQIMKQLPQQPFGKQASKIFKCKVDKNVKSGLSDYNYFVPEQDEMYLEKIRNKTSSGKYTNKEQFRADIHQILINARKYNLTWDAELKRYRSLGAYPAAVDVAENLANWVDEQLEQRELEISSAESAWAGYYGSAAAGVVQQAATATATEGGAGGAYGVGYSNQYAQTVPATVPAEVVAQPAAPAPIPKIKLKLKVDAPAAATATQPLVTSFKIKAPQVVPAAVAAKQQPKGTIITTADQLADPSLSGCKAEAYFVDSADPSQTGWYEIMIVDIDVEARHMKFVYMADGAADEGVFEDFVGAIAL